MYKQALTFARQLSNLLNQHRFHDDGAVIQVTVTDIDGATSSVAWDQERRMWGVDEGVDLDLALLRDGNDGEKEDARKRLQGRRRNS